MKFVKSSHEKISVEMEIMNSHPDYNLLADGKRLLDEKDLLEEHQEGHNLEKERYLIEVEGKYIGIIDFIMKNPRDGKPWLGLLIIHKAWTRQSLAEKALSMYEEMMKKRGIPEVRLGCFAGNQPGLSFWKKQGFKQVKQIKFRDKPLWIMGKNIE
ncbi:GNAT family N-acetyltransferase [Bacillus sp. ISL-35]|uniref:GNAT family N-acetyltransferase n=1 Tax=Bacillus sp. ISL-35 TaxID=2819122 RepID=UPI001BE50048|nr:GNAT family N-acetyltransferase [Bacillus sp. ISL-35]MBT2679420.1 GNAT family N-acetyltransferase [Bacillus sp. ISL-35]